MVRQRLKRKITVSLHCLFRWHRRGIIRCENPARTEKWTKWVCATCAERAPWFQHQGELTQDDLEWAKRVAMQLGWHK